MEAAQVRLSLHLSKCHIVGNHMLRLKSSCYVGHMYPVMQEKDYILKQNFPISFPFDISLCLFVSLIDSLRPINNLSVKLGRVFLG